MAKATTCKCLLARGDGFDLTADDPDRSNRITRRFGVNYPPSLEDQIKHVERGVVELGANV